MEVVGLKDNYSEVIKLTSYYMKTDYFTTFSIEIYKWRRV